MSKSVINSNKTAVGLAGKGNDVVVANKPPLQLPVPLTGFATAREAGVEGDSAFLKQPGVSASNDAGGDAVFAESAKGVALHGRSSKLAGLFEGNVQVTGNIDLTGPTSDITLQNEDCAEQFNVSDEISSLPGMVMVIEDDGLLRPGRREYDRRVAGVISGAGEFRPAVTLGVKDSPHLRVPIAMMGKVYCLVDASATAIHAGDLLTTSATEGHAMAVAEPARAFGTIIGKALRPLASGKGLIPILIALQ